MGKGASVNNGPTGSYSGPCAAGRSDTGQVIRSASHWDYMEGRDPE